MPTKSYADWVFCDLLGREIAMPSVTWTWENLDKYSDCAKLDIERKIPGIKQVVFNKDKGYTTVLWNDDTSTVVHCGEGDHFERYFGFCTAIIKKLFGSTTAAKNLMDKYDLEKEKERKEQERQERVAAQLEMERKNRERKERERANLHKIGLNLDKVECGNKDVIKELIAMLQGGDKDGD